MLRPLFFILAFLALFPVSAQAGLFDRDDVQKMLAAPTVSIDDYELAKDELTTLYALRHNNPAWNFFGSDNAAAFAAFMESLESLIAYHGLQRQDYAIELMRKLASSSDSDSKSKLELLVTDTLLRLVHDLHGDDLDLDDLYPGWNFHRDEIDMPSQLAAAIAGNHLNEFMNGLVPQNPAYQVLVKALQTYSALAANGGWPLIDAGPTLRLHDRGPRVVQLRHRLAAESYLPQQPLPSEQSEEFDETLRKAVMDYQARNGLEVDGNSGGKTFEALNKSVAFRIDQIRANMERWRHMSDHFPPDRYILVNIPNVTADIFKNGQRIYSDPVIVGRVDRKTPFIQSNVRSMIVNPAWHVPTKIARKDILPKLRKDPHYLEKLGFVISGHESDPHGDNIDWKSMSDREFSFRLRQSPGDMNSLGRLKFDFDNDFAVYMHGTPHQELFKKNVRDLSSGCVRLRDPQQVAEILLADNKEPWDAKRIEDEINSTKTHWVAIAKPMPLYIVYWTVFADDKGQLNFRDDVYDYDRFLMSALQAGTRNEGDDTAPETEQPTENNANSQAH